MFEKKIRDIMIPLEKYAVVSKESTLRETVAILQRSYCELESGMCTEAGPRTVFVVDDKNNLLGILDFRTILKALIPEIGGGLTKKLEALGISVTYAEQGTPSLDEARADFFARAQRNAQTKVTDIMLKIKGTIQSDADILDALKLTFKNKITKLPVYDGDVLVGVVRDTDLFLAVAEILNETR